MAKIGSAVTAVKEGDRVSGDPNDMCGECYFCKNAMQCVGNIHTQADAAGFLKEGRKWSLLYSRLYFSIDFKNNFSLVKAAESAL